MLSDESTRGTPTAEIRAGMERAFFKRGKRRVYGKPSGGKWWDRDSDESHGEGRFADARAARRSLTPLEERFFHEAHHRWPHLSWRRYHPVTLRIRQDLPSTWYAPFLSKDKKLIVVIEDRPDFPYRVYGQNFHLYAANGYTVFDFSEDFSAPLDESVWTEAMAMIDAKLRELKGTAYEQAEGEALTAMMAK